MILLYNIKTDRKDVVVDDHMYNAISTVYNMMEDYVCELGKTDGNSISMFFTCDNKLSGKCLYEHFNGIRELTYRYVCDMISLGYGNVLHEEYKLNNLVGSIYIYNYGIHGFKLLLHKVNNVRLSMMEANNMNDCMKAYSILFNSCYQNKQMIDKSLFAYTRGLFTDTDLYNIVQNINNYSDMAIYSLFTTIGYYGVTHNNT